jgi:hypothetical protein
MLVSHELIVKQYFKIFIYLETDFMQLVRLEVVRIVSPLQLIITIHCDG